jgi:hypothetical protein
MKKIRQTSLPIYRPILNQRLYSSVAGFDPVMTNNLIARNILQVDEVVEGRGRGERRFTPFRAWEGRILNESFTNDKMALADAAKIAEVGCRLARTGGYVDHWAGHLNEGNSFIAGFMIWAWSDGHSYDAQLISGDKQGWPDFSSAKDMRRFFARPFLIVPLSDLFADVWQKCVTMLAANEKA